MQAYALMVAQRAVSGEFDLVTDTHLEEVAEDEFSLCIEGIRLNDEDDRGVAINIKFELGILIW